LTIGRGNAAFDPSVIRQEAKETSSFLGSTINKTAVFRAMGSILSKDNWGEKWALHIPTIHHALVTANLTSDVLPRTVKEANPEKIICEFFTTGISSYLSNPAKALECFERGNGKENQISDESIPLSLTNARLFTIALCRLPEKEQLKTLSTFVTSLHSHLVKIENESELRNLFTYQNQLSRFLARTITLCSNCINMVLGGKNLLTALCEEIGPNHYELPSFSNNTADGNDMSDGERYNDWYKRESCFMGLWADWESPAIPPIDTHENIVPLSSSDELAFKNIVEISLRLGFESANIDQCYLLFSAWNASSKLCLMNQSKWAGPLTAKEFVEGSNASACILLRDDVCNIHSQFDREGKTMPDSFLSKTIEKSKTLSQGRGSLKAGIESLKIGISEGLKSLAFFKSSLLSEGVQQAAQIEKVVTCETLVAYISVMISLHTTTTTEFNSAIIHRDKSRCDRKRKGSSISGESQEDVGMDEDASDDSCGSESIHNDFDEDDEDEKFDGVHRLHEVCDFLGSSPLHPDWLDNTCRLRVGLTKTYALNSAEKALAELVDLGSIAYTQYSNSLVKALSCAMETKDTNQSENISKLLLDILSGMPQGSDSNEDCLSQEWVKSLSELLNVDLSTISAIGNNFLHKNVTSVTETFFPNSSQRIHGNLQHFFPSMNAWLPTSAELRSGREWELLMSSSLSGSCVDIDAIFLGLDNEVSDLNERKIALKEALSWRRLLQSILSALVPVTSLLRFSLENCRGRERHHLAIFDSNTDGSELSHKASPVIAGGGNNQQRSSLKSNVSKALCLLSEIQGCSYVDRHSRQCARSVTCNLIGSKEDLHHLEGVVTKRNAILGIKGLIEITESLKPEDLTNGVYLAMEELIDLRQCSRDDLNLLFSLGFPCNITVNTIAGSSMPLRKIFSEIESNEDYWSWEILQKEVLDMLMKISHGRCSLGLKPSIRSRSIAVVKSLLEANERHIENDKQCLMISCVLKGWDSLTPDVLSQIIRSDICLQKGENDTPSTHGDYSSRLCVSQNLSSTLAFLTRDECSVCRLALKVVRQHLDHWILNEDLNHILYLLCLLSSRYNEIQEVGTELLSMAVGGEGVKIDDKSSSRRLVILETFYHFLRGKIKGK
jgi:hypothetical protein